MSTNCPLKFSNPDRLDWGVECDKEKCAWFNPVLEQCAMFVLVWETSQRIAKTEM